MRTRHTIDHPTIDHGTRDPDTDLRRMHSDEGPLRRSSATFAGLAVIAALTLGAAACSSDDSEPGLDDPVEIPADPLDTEPALEE